MAAVEALSGDMEWVEEECVERKENIARTKLRKVFRNLVGVSKEDYCFDSCFPAYMMFVDFNRQKFHSSDGRLKLERIWELFWKKYHDDKLYKISYPSSSLYK